MKYLLLVGMLLALWTPVSAQTPVPQPLAYDNPNSPVDLLASYYNAINRGEYQRAYNYWQNAPADSYTSFCQRLCGYGQRAVDRSAADLH